MNKVQALEFFNSMVKIKISPKSWDYILATYHDFFQVFYRKQVMNCRHNMIDNYKKKRTSSNVVIC